MGTLGERQGLKFVATSHGSPWECRTGGWTAGRTWKASDAL